MYLKESKLVKKPLKGQFQRSLGRLEGPLVLVVEGDLSEGVGGEIVHVGGLAPLVGGDALAPEGTPVVRSRSLRGVLRH